MGRVQNDRCRNFSFDSRNYEKIERKAGWHPFRMAVSDFCAGKNLLEKK
jgi:hypothetical protein